MNAGRAICSKFTVTSGPLAAVVWATGYRPAYAWIALPIIAADGHPQHQRGLTAAPGVAFLGLDWLDSRGSALLNGAGTDARRVVAALLAAPGQCPNVVETQPGISGLNHHKPPPERAGYLST